MANYPGYVGTSSYYSCPKGKGTCATCNSSGLNEVAYPSINGHPPNYAANCGPIPTHSCGDVLSIGNYCDCNSPTIVNLTVVDHGPGAACMVDTPQCDLCTCTPPATYYRLIDVPQNTFTQLGGNIAQGLIIIGWN